MVAHHAQLLVPAKLTPPEPLPTWVPRERLAALLGPEPQARLTLVVAPAGFGKSTLAAQWLAGAARATSPPVAWLTLDEHDQDALRFLAYLVGAVERAAPGACATALELLGAAAPPSFAVLQALLVDLSALPAGLTLVLDDYDRVAAAPVHESVAYLLRNLPPLCRLVLLSRVDPPLPLARLRAERQLRELREADLRFTEGETGALLASLGCPPAGDHVRALHRQTEGWALALQLAALAQLDGAAWGQGVAAATRQIAEYLADEVLARQTAQTQETLLALAAPERFCAGLLAALRDEVEGEIAAESRLDELARANLFLIPLNGDRRWFRFHHLFRDLLLRRLHLDRGQARVRELHRRAAAWFAAEGLAEEAVRHYLAAGDEDAAADLVERLLLPEMGRDVAAAPPGYWLRMLPAGLLARRPGLALIVARLSVFNMDIAGFAERLAHIDELLAAPGAPGAAPWPTFQADLTALRGVLSYWQGRPAETIAYMRAALEQGPTQALTVQAGLQLALAYSASGDYAEGVRLIGAGLPGAAARLGERHALLQHSCLAIMHQVAGDLDRQAHHGRLLAQEATAHRTDDFWLGYAAAALGHAAYERGDLDVAAAHFATLLGRKYRVSYPGYMGGVIGLALVALARGSLDQAAAFADEARAFAEETGGDFLRHQALGCAARVALATDDVEGALWVSAAISADMHLGMSLALEVPQLTRVRALLAAGDPGRLALADELLAPIVEQTAACHNVRLLIRALAVLALLREGQGRPADADAALDQALALAEPRRFRRTFLDLGPALPPLLRRAAGAGRAPAYVAGLLAAAPPVAPAAPPAEAPELLTPRESEILALLAERWSDKEIAARLVITPNTVRKHTSTLYQKLGVGDRRHAVAAAQALGLLSADPPAAIAVAARRATP
jgi:LuxR family maltose regulon positive regulatory protein